MNREQMIVEAALRKMFASGHFSICTIDSCLKVLAIPNGGKTYAMLSALHCVDYAQMDPSLRAALPGMVAEVLAAAPLDFEAIFRPVQSVQQMRTVEPEPQPQRAGGLLRLIGIGGVK